MLVLDAVTIWMTLCHSAMRQTHGRICAFSQLLQLLKGAWMTLVHGWYPLTTSETPDADGRVGPVL